MTKNFLLPFLLGASLTLAYMVGYDRGQRHVINEWTCSLKLPECREVKHE